MQRFVTTGCGRGDTIFGLGDGERDITTGGLGVALGVDVVVGVTTGRVVVVGTDVATGIAQ